MPTEAENAAAMMECFRIMEANFWMECYRHDKNPKHVHAAFRVWQRRGLTPPAAILRNLDRVLDMPVPKAKLNTPRDLQILHSVLGRDGQIPDRINGQLENRIARKHGITVDNVRVVVSRWREKLASVRKGTLEKAWPITKLR